MYCKCFQNGKWYVCHNTLDQSLYQSIISYIELEPILDQLPDISDQLSPQLIQEMLKASGVDFSKFKHVINVKRQKCNTVTQATKI